MSDESTEVEVRYEDDRIEVVFARGIFVDDMEREYVEKAYRVGGDIFEVHLSDADPYPSNPHAHIVDGPGRVRGCKVHLGTGAIYLGRLDTGLRLHHKQFASLIRMIQPKFPAVKLPLSR